MKLEKQIKDLAKGIVEKLKFLTQKVKDRIYGVFTEIPILEQPLVSDVEMIETKETSEEFTKRERFEQLEKEPETLQTAGLIVERIIEQPTIVERTIERIINGVTGADLDIKLSQLNNRFLQQISDVKELIGTRATANFRAIALTSKIELLWKGLKP